jgi:hypothetical protein
MFARDRRRAESSIAVAAIIVAVAATAGAALMGFLIPAKAGARRERHAAQRLA